MFPHDGGLDHRTVRAAYEFNHAMRIIKPIFQRRSYYEAFQSVRLLGSPSIILDCVKRGEDDPDVSRGELPKRKDRSVILRVYDSLGGTAKGTVEWDPDYLPVECAFLTNILEDDLHEISYPKAKASFDFVLRPFEVATFRLQLSS